MNHQDKSKDELIKELQKLQQEFDSLKTSYSKDIIERKRSEEALRESEEHFSILFNEALDGICLADAETGLIIDCNQALSSLVGRERVELIGQSQKILHPPNKNNAIFSPEFEQHLVDKEDKTLETQIVTSTGIIREVEIKAKHININGRKTLQGVFRDITVRKRAEQALLADEERYRLLITNIRDVIYSVDVVTKEFKYLSPSFERITGYILEDIKEMGGRMPFLTKVMTEAKFTEQDNYLLQLNEGHLDTDFKNETWWLCKDGSYKCLQDHWIPIYVNGKLVSTDGILMDITERKQAEAEIQLKNELLQTINAEKDKFFSIIAHDLRGPIGAFLSATQVLTEEIKVMTIEEIKEITQDMKNSAANIYSLLENLLEWSRMQRGITKFQPEQFILMQKIVDDISMVNDSARKKSIKIDYNVPENLMVFADKHMFDTVIRNLVSNAIKFTQREGIINISASITKDNTVEIQIKDSGIGISEDMISKLFKLNENTSRKGTEDEPSTGLGLLLCKEFVEKNGGKIWVESEEGKGSIFYFTIPYNPLLEEISTIENVVSAEDKEVQVKKLKILIVEDDKISYSLLTKMLQKISYEVLHAITGVQAIEACRNNPDLDLVLMDIRMPQMDGNEATRQIRQFNKDVIIIAQTAHGFSSDREKSIEAGCNDYIAKPINKNELLSLIQKYFGK